MKRNNVSRSFNQWLLGGVFIALASLATIVFAPHLVGAMMGYGGDGVGQFFCALLIGGAGFVVLCIASVLLLMVSLVAWIS